jgi:hypothetical protein
MTAQPTSAVSSSEYRPVYAPSFSVSLLLSSVPTISTGHLNAQFLFIHDSTPAPDYPLVWSLPALMGAQIPLQQNESEGLTNLRHHRYRGCLDSIQSTLPLQQPAAP